MLLVYEWEIHPALGWPWWPDLVESTSLGGNPDPEAAKQCIVTQAGQAIFLQLFQLPGLRD
jgi:hypothetical protein